MSNRIYQLPPIVANQIAAGEVVDRPASVIKELLENSLDAESTYIEVVVEKGGANLIRITDNGTGIAKDDLVLALSRHATSKITVLEDLTGISSLGFRGEALASIASVSSLTLTSKVAEAAWQIRVEGEQQEPIIIPAAHPRGTSVEVNNLFFNTPVRRKFLRSERTEFLHVEDVIKRAALSHFNVAFKFIADGKEIFNLSPALTIIEQEKRVAKLCGKNFLATSIALQQQAEGLQISGWLCSPEQNRAHSDLQYFFLNGRIIKDRVINHALRSATREIIPEGRYLSYILYLQCDPKTVDVNVHPTKHEVRFQQSRLIHDFINTAITKAFHGEIVANYLEPETFYQPEMFVQEALAEYTVVSKKVYRQLGKVLALVKQYCLITEIEQGLTIIDLIKAKQQLFQQQLENALHNPLISQPLLIPKTIYLSSRQLEKLLALELKDFGIELHQTAPDTLIIRSVPQMLKDSDLEKLIAHLLQNQSIITSIATVAATTSVKMSLDNLQTLVQQLEQLPQLSTDCWRSITLP